MFLTGTLLNVATVLLGTSLGLLAGARVPRRMQESLATGLGGWLGINAQRGGTRAARPPQCPREDQGSAERRTPPVAR